jgi:hypothetical protein
MPAAKSSGRSAQSAAGFCIGIVPKLLTNRAGVGAAKACFDFESV